MTTSKRTPKAPPRALLLRASAICLRTLREKAGLAQETLAQEAGIDRAYMGGLERGEHSPTLVMLYRLFPALGVSFAEYARCFEGALKAAKRERDSPAAAAA